MSKRYLHVREEDGAEQWFDQPPAHRPFLTVEVIDCGRDYVDEKTWTKLVSLPDGKDIAPAPHGNGWIFAGQENSHEFGKSQVWVRRREL